MSKFDVFIDRDRFCLSLSCSDQCYAFRIIDYYADHDWVDKLWLVVKEKNWCENKNLNKHMSQICNKVISRQRKSWLYYNNNAFSNFREDHQIAALEKKFFINVLKHMTQFGEEKLRLLYFHATVISTRCLGKVFDATWFKQQLKPVLTNASEKERYKCLHIIIDLFNKKEIQTTNQSSSTKKEWTQAIKWLVLRIDTQEQWFTIYRKSGIEVDWIVDLFEQKAQMSLKIFFLARVPKS